jgi:hypothetical protein
LPSAIRKMLGALGLTKGGTMSQQREEIKADLSRI